jgi:hypothetical protein
MHVTLCNWLGEVTELHVLPSSVERQIPPETPPARIVTFGGVPVLLSMPNALVLPPTLFGPLAVQVSAVVSSELEFYSGLKFLF